MLLSESLPIPPWSPEWQAFLQAAAWTAPFLAAAALFSLLRASLLHSHAPRVLGRIPSPRRRARIEPLLARADRLATSAGILEVACELGFATELLRSLAGS